MNQELTEAIEKIVTVCFPGLPPLHLRAYRQTMTDAITPAVAKLEAQRDDWQRAALLQQERAEKAEAQLKFAQGFKIVEPNRSAT